MAAALSSLASGSELPPDYSSESEEDNNPSTNDVSDPDELSLSDTIARQTESEEDELSIYMDDIGALLQKMPQSSISNLPAPNKYFILTKHFRPGNNFKFPSRHLDGCNRSCQYKYLQENPWFVYSKIEDGLFCLPCVLFARKEDLGQFVHEKLTHGPKKQKSLRLTIKPIITFLL